MNEYVYLGVVGSVDAQSRARIEQRNKFCVGDEIEIMKPSGMNVSVKVLHMYNAEGEEVESCPHSKQLIDVELTQAPERYDILRVRNFVESEQ